MSHPILMKQYGSDYMTRGRTRAIDHIVEHYSGTLASAHFFVDDISEEIYQSVAEVLMCNKKWSECASEFELCAH